jgi:murein DD-endopeptidase MepM/ murein hydrolase activator NlpD
VSNKLGVNIGVYLAVAIATAVSAIEVAASQEQYNLIDPNLVTKPSQEVKPVQTPSDRKTDPKAAGADPPLCGTAPMDALKKHKVQQGETLESIAKKYKLTSATIAGLNPNARDGIVEVGQTLSIPPFNGVAYQLANEDTYKAIASKFNVRSDVLFERNACQPKPKVVFVPGAVWKPNPIIAKILPFATNETIILQSGGYPLPYAVPVTSNYGWRVNPVTQETAFHSGIDLGAPMGTPVLATKAGRVEFAGWSGGYGNLVELNHSSFGTRYAHLETIYVAPGQKVVKGQQVGLVGSTGRSTGPHLHFEILNISPDGWVSQDPAPYLSHLLAMAIDTVGYFM